MVTSDENPDSADPSMIASDSSSASPPREAPFSIALAGLLGGALCGLWIARLTLQLNPAFDGKLFDRLTLSFWLAALYAGAGLGRASFSHSWGAWATKPFPPLRGAPGASLRPPGDSPYWPHWLYLTRDFTLPP